MLGVKNSVIGNSFFHIFTQNISTIEYLIKITIVLIRILHPCNMINICIKKKSRNECILYLLIQSQEHTIFQCHLKKNQHKEK